ncbi:MAG: pyridoxine 5'-phosphate synthase [candidate division NC10 bacterium]|jgi:pyridoxine 5-phosphate synthase|nr:pyridoxine 5'-phosphate synthase [candidate division NC10 bacterium]
MTTLFAGLDHLATLRSAGGGRDPDPVVAAALAELAGADGIRLTCGRERGGVQDRDVRLLREVVRTMLILRMPPQDECLKLALAVRPDIVTLIPGEREGLGVERGLDVEDRRQELVPFLDALKGIGILTAVLVDPLPNQVKAAHRAGAGGVLLHAGRFCWASDDASRAAEFEALTNAAKVGHRLGLIVQAGGGLGYQSVGVVAAISEIGSVDVGHALIARAALVGTGEAVRELRNALSGGAAR